MMIALYMRVSQAAHGGAGAPGGRGPGVASPSIAGQRLQLLGHVQAMRSSGALRAWEADGVAEYADDGWSGMSAARPALARMLAACREGRVDCVMVNDLSRLSRSYIDLADMVERAFPRDGVRFVSRAEGIDLPGIRSRPGLGAGAPAAAAVPDAEAELVSGAMAVPDAEAELVRGAMAVPDAEAELVRGIAAVLNNAYSVQLSATVRAGMRASWNRGEHVQAFAPFGYVYDRDARGHLRVDPVAGRWVLLMFELAAAGWPPADIAAELNARGIPTPAGYAKAAGGPKAGCYGGATTPWNARKVRRILRAEAYAGTLVGGSTRQLAVGKGSPKRTTADWERVRVEGAHEPVVSREVWEAVQGMLGDGR